MNKRLAAANFLLALGGGKLGKRAGKSAVFIINYHRIRKAGNAHRTMFDGGVFGPDENEFRKQMAFLRKHTAILGEEELICALAGRFPDEGPYSIITFDDAYRDNYDLALPPLAEFSIPAFFFVPVLAIENRQLGWWDQIAFIVRNSPKREITLRGELFPLREQPGRCIARLQSAMKLRPETETRGMVEELAEVASSPLPPPQMMDSELMTWEQLKEAHNAGITLGSHTYSHKVLATLTEEEQAGEIITSKNWLENKLGVPIRSLAYPVGGPAHFNQASQRLAEKAGYQLAFSFNTGVARFGAFSRYAIPRLAAPDTCEELRAALYFPGLMDYANTSLRRLLAPWRA